MLCTEETEKTPTKTPKVPIYKATVNATLLIKAPLRNTHKSTTVDASSPKEKHLCVLPIKALLWTPPRQKEKHHYVRPPFHKSTPCFEVPKPYSKRHHCEGLPQQKGPTCIGSLTNKALLWCET